MYVAEQNPAVGHGGFEALDSHSDGVDGGVKRDVREGQPRAVGSRKSAQRGFDVALCGGVAVEVGAHVGQCDVRFREYPLLGERFRKHVVAHPRTANHHRVDREAELCRRPRRFFLESLYYRLDVERRAGRVAVKVQVEVEDFGIADGPFFIDDAFDEADTGAEMSYPFPKRRVSP